MIPGGRKLLAPSKVHPRSMVAIGMGQSRCGSGLHLQVSPGAVFPQVLRGLWAWPGEPYHLLGRPEGRVPSAIQPLSLWTVMPVKT